jgi:carboxymethylenebutenolidase
MGDLTALEAAGRDTRSYEAGEWRAGAPGVVVFHAWWGLNDDLLAYADRLGATGFAVVAPDLYRGSVADTVEEAERLADSLDQADADAIALAAVDRLAERIGPAGRIAAVGFSLGAGWALWTPAERGVVTASVVYYGSLSGPALRRTNAPVLGHFAADDPYESEDDLAAFAATLREAGRDVAIHRYPGTGHWFAEPSREAYRPEAAALAFERTVAFLRENASTTSR